MIRILTDEESVECADKAIGGLVTAFISTRIAYPGTSIEALAQVLWMVNGPDWIGASDMARAKVRAKQVESANSAASGLGKAGLAIVEGE